MNAIDRVIKPNVAAPGGGGGVALFDGGTYPAWVSEVDDSQILFISRLDLRQFCLEHPRRRGNGAGASIA